MTIDLDGKWSMQWGSGGSPESSDLPRQQPGHMESYSSSTTVIVKQRPDGVSYCMMSCKNLEGWGGGGGGEGGCYANSMLMASCYTLLDLIHRLMKRSVSLKILLAKRRYGN